MSAWLEEKKLLMSNASKQEQELVASKKALQLMQGKGRQIVAVLQKKEKELIQSRSQIQNLTNTVCQLASYHRRANFYCSITIILTLIS